MIEEECAETWVVASEASSFGTNEMPQDLTCVWHGEVLATHIVVVGYLEHCTPLTQCAFREHSPVAILAREVGPSGERNGIAKVCLGSVFVALEQTIVKC